MHRAADPTTRMGCHHLHYYPWLRRCRQLLHPPSPHTAGPNSLAVQSSRSPYSHHDTWMACLGVLRRVQVCVCVWGDRRIETRFSSLRILRSRMTDSAAALWETNGFGRPLFGGRLCRVSCFTMGLMGLRTMPNAGGALDLRLRFRCPTNIFGFWFSCLDFVTIILYTTRSMFFTQHRLLASTSVACTLTWWTVIFGGKKWFSSAVFSSVAGPMQLCNLTHTLRRIVMIITHIYEDDDISTDDSKDARSFAFSDECMRKPMDSRAKTRRPC